MIFVDTSFLFPLLSEKDPDHGRVRAALEGYRGRTAPRLFLTTNFVIAETLTLIRTTPPRSHAATVRAGRWLYSEAFASVHWATRQEEEAAFEYLVRHEDKEYSFVDCLSFVVMEKLEIREALTLDADFAHRFIVRPGPA